jgi:stage V sporulation protein S
MGTLIIRSFLYYLFIYLVKKLKGGIMEILKVSSKSNPSKVAGAIANIFRESGNVEIQTIGAGSLNQAIKAIAIARGFVAPSGENLVVIPSFSDIVIEGEQKTAIKLLITSK